MALRFTRLTRPDVRALMPGEKIREHGVTGERLANRDVRWSVDIMVHGARIHRVIGFDSERVTRSQAEDFIEAKRQEAEEGRLSLPRGRKTALTFRKATNQFIEKLAGEGGKNIGRKKAQFGNRLKSFFKD